MNKIYKIFFSLVMSVLMLVACTPDDHSLGKVDISPSDLVEGIAFTITHDSDNPNIVYLKSLMESQYTPLWEHPQGRSQEKEVTLKIAFDGTYEVTFGVETRGGIVYGEPTSFVIDDFYAGFVEHELWTNISGGVGKEKVWYLDLDAEGVSRYFDGPLYFYGTDDSWFTVTLGEEVDGDSWNWRPDYAGNDWLMSKADFGTMIFSLVDGPKITVDHKTLSNRGVENGTYLLDVDNYVLELTDATPLHDSGRDPVVSRWGYIKILSLTENTMQLGVLRDQDPEDDECLLVYNYISKEYYDNWVPGEDGDDNAEPPYEGDANQDLTSETTTTRKWVLSLATPYNWTHLNGDIQNEDWNSPEDYLATGWAPYEESLLKNVSLTLSKTGENSGDYLFTDGSGNEIKGQYVIDENNNIYFKQAISYVI